MSGPQRAPELVEGQPGRTVVAVADVLQLQLTLPLHLFDVEARRGEAGREELEGAREVPGQEVAPHAHGAAAGGGADACAAQVQLFGERMGAEIARTAGE